MSLSSAIRRWKKHTGPRRLAIKTIDIETPPTLVHHTSDTEEVDANMGKSNKFDYTNRTNSGTKLGHIIGNALQKEAEKVLKDAERHSQKARKASIGSVGGSPDDSHHLLDLKVPGKALGDDGVCALADGLEIALKDGTGVASLALEDLNLSGNDMTTASLVRLAPIIELAKYDIKTINLSGNRISVETNEQAAQWEAFLRSFRNCQKLRRLDLSGNNELGQRAMEIFARIHIEEKPITPSPPGGTTSVLSLVSEQEEEQDDGVQVSAPNGEASDDDEDFGSAMLKGRFINRKCGLRSIPYITLHEVGLNDAGALWLSFVVEEHHYPTQLIDELNAPNPDSIIKAYQQDTHSRGIDWTNNKSLGKEGAQLLDRAEMVRNKAMLDNSTAGSSVIDDTDSLFADDEHVRRHSLDQHYPRPLRGERRVSVRSIRTTDGGEHEASDLESARRKIQRFLISHEGSGSVELWKSALIVFRASRILLYVAPTSRRIYTGATLFKREEVSSPASPTVVPPTPMDSPVAGSPPQLTIDTTKATASGSRKKTSYAATLVAGSNSVAGEPELAVTDVTNTPTTPLRLQRPTHRKGGFSEGTNLETVTEKLNVLVVRDDSSERYLRWQEKHIAAAASEGKVFREEIVPCNLPIDVIEHVLRFTMSRRELDVMNEGQRRAALARGQSRETLRGEREWLKKDESAQVWMLLDSINCLAYGI